MLEFFFDFETRSRSDLRKVGAVKYALDPSTEATLITWAIADGPVKAWRYGQPIPHEIIDVARNPDNYKFIAHNVEFDYLIWTKVFCKKQIATMNPFPKPKIENLDCTKAIGQRFCAGSALNDLAKILKLPQTKDADGRKIMLKQCKPKTVGKEKGQFPKLTDAEWDKFEYYGIIDTVLLRQCYRVLPRLSGLERWSWEWTFLYLRG
jgi:DNA polymerase bacteriophage-type